MKSPRIYPDFNTPRFAVLSAALLVCLLAPTTAAQESTQAPRWSADDRETIWKEQAEDAADNLGVTGNDRSELSALYVLRRKALQEQLEALDTAAQMGQAAYDEHRRLVETERGKFKTALSGILEDEQAQAVAASLGSFSRQWDRLLMAWREIGLDPEKSKQGRQMIAAYIVDWEKTRGGDTAEGDTDSLRDELDFLKVSLDLSLATLLSDEQQTQWQRASQQRTSQFRSHRPGEPGRRRR